MVSTPSALIPHWSGLQNGMAASPMIVVSVAAPTAAALASISMLMSISMAKASQLRSLNPAISGTILDSVSDGLKPSATAGTLFSMDPIRTYEDLATNFDTVASRFAQPADDEMCDRWAVVNSISEPSETVEQLAKLHEWCVVVVGGESGEC